VNLGDAVAEELEILFEQISLEMIYRGMYHFYVAYQKELAFDPVEYFAEPQNRDLGIVKRENLEIGWFPLWLLKREVLNCFLPTSWNKLHHFLSCYFYSLE
jgi:hypothetical protein